MKIYHKTLNVNGVENIYIYVTVEDIYEFAKENLDGSNDSNFLTKLRKYIKDNFKNKLFSSAFIVINGILIGSLSLASIYSINNETNANISGVSFPIYTEENIAEKEDANTSEKEEQTNVNTSVSTHVIHNNTLQTKEDKKEDTTKNKTTNKITTAKKETSKKSDTKKNVSTTTNKTTAAINKNTNTKNPSSNSTSTKPTSSNTSAPTTSTNKETTITKPSSNSSTTSNTTQIIPSNYKIKLNNNGTVITLGLEDYIIGVVAAEMPASFNIEALKAQAVVARTYAMKKASKGTVLQNSTYHQVYNTNEQLNKKWGASYNTYYNKVKNAVSSTKGEVLKYNGVYIEALYFSMSNGKTELPSYVWTTDYPYLKVVSSSWDENISGSKYTMNFTYKKLSEKLGVNVNKDSDIIILSKTPGDRINEIAIAGKTFKGTKIKALLGLRSTDFNITKTDIGFTITTIGFGHGVGMSQYGANGAAKSGMTYKQILNHYYSGANLVKI